MAPPSRRPRIIGPFFLIALLLSAGFLVWQKHQREVAVAMPPVVEHQVVGGGNSGDEVVPRPDLVLDYADDLKLSAAQRQKL